MKVDPGLYDIARIVADFDLPTYKVRAAIKTLGLEGRQYPIDMRKTWFTYEQVRAIWNYLTGTELVDSEDEGDEEGQ